LRTGIVEFDAGSNNVISVPCTIRDVSSTGARLEFNSSLPLPKQFTLIFSDGLRKTCQAIWRKGRVVGTAFADGPARPDEQAIMITEEEQARHRRQIGARIREAREARDFSQAKLDELIGASSGFTALAEKGEAEIPLYQLMRIADLLLVSLDRLVAGPTSGEVTAA
jgi:hypothetical protein